MKAVNTFNVVYGSFQFGHSEQVLIRQEINRLKVDNFLLILMN